MVISVKKRKIKVSKWSCLISLAAFLMLIVVSFFPKAWSVDLELREDSTNFTPISQIQGEKLQDSFMQPAHLDGNIGVEAIKSLELQPESPSLQPAKPQDNGAPVSMSSMTPTIRTMPTFAVFPVMLHGAREKAFSDLPIVLSTALANQLAEKFSKEGLGYTVINPIYAYDDLKERGLDGLYQKVVRDYMEAGRPNEKDLLYLADHLSTKVQRVDWVVFVEAEFDLNNNLKPFGRKEVYMARLVGGKPLEPNYFVKGTMQIFSATYGTPLVWRQSTTTRVKLSDFGNFTRSVYDDSDSTYSFKLASDKMAQQLTTSLPETSYITSTNVKASLVDSSVPATITPQDQETLKKILQP